MSCFVNNITMITKLGYKYYVGSVCADQMKHVKKCRNWPFVHKNAKQCHKVRF